MDKKDQLATEYLECRRRVWDQTDRIFAFGHLLEVAGSVIDREEILNAKAVQTLGKCLSESAMRIESELDAFLGVPEAESMAKRASKGSSGTGA